MKLNILIACLCVPLVLSYAFWEKPKEVESYETVSAYELSKDESLKDMYSPKDEEADLVSENSDNQIVNDLIIETAREYNLDARVLRAICEKESRMNADAVGDGGEAYGLMQIQPKWHKERMARLGVTDLLDPQQNIMVGADLLRELLDMHGTYERALNAYNTGDPDNYNGYSQEVMSFANEK